MMGVIMSAFVVSCSDDDKEWVQELVLGETRVTTTPNTTSTVLIEEGSGDYSVTISDPEIADVHVELENSESHLVIKTKKTGFSVITVSDRKSGKSADCSLTVKTYTHAFAIRSVLYAVDAEKKDAIEAELRDNPPFPVGSSFEIIGTSEEHALVIRHPDQEVIASGVLTYDKVDEFSDVYKLLTPENHVLSAQKWNMHLGENLLVYDMFLIKGEISTYSDMVGSLHIRLYEDLTAQYKAKYPDAGVKGVVRALVCERLL